MKKTIIITGASDGIGKAAARQLHADGNTVVLVGRSPQKTKAIADELGASYYIADFSKLSDVKKLASALQKDFTTIDVLALNAGGIFSERVITADGFEQTFQVNHLAHFYLVELLMKTLIKSHASIIATSSSANYFNQLDLDDLNAEHGYRKWTVYGTAKLMNILFIRELDQRFGSKGISTAAFHPGIVSTSFSRDLGPVLKAVFSSKLMRPFGLITPSEGADTLVWLAKNKPGDVWQSGAYYTKRRIRRASHKAYDPKLSRQLWEKSEDAKRVARTLL